MTDNTRKNTYLEKINYEVLNPPLTTGTAMGMTTKGDLITHNGTDAVRLPVSTNDFVVTADSAQTTGVKWAPIIGFDTRANGHLYSRNTRIAATQSIPHNTATAVTFTATSGEAASPATRTGMYLFTFGGRYAAHVGLVSLAVAINGTAVGPAAKFSGDLDGAAATVSGSRYVPVTSGDTMALQALQTSGGALNVDDLWFDWVFIGKQ
jgi:trimeric autotransporter adhesin